jgi:XTP/dITP diphosphohydrolase
MSIPSIQTWVLASRNQGKARELEKWLQEANIQVKTLDEVGFVGDVEETGTTFEANAQLKAQEVWHFLQSQGGEKALYPVLSDDSGLEVDALEGAPGVYSARFALEEAKEKGIPGDVANNQKLLRVLKENSNRSARYVCVLCLVESEKPPQFFRGTCEGTIAEQAQGENGFGYDPLFVPEGHTESFGVLPVELKKTLSHRSKALQELLQVVSF